MIIGAWPHGMERVTYYPTNAARRQNGKPALLPLVGHSDDSTIEATSRPARRTSSRSGGSGGGGSGGGGSDSSKEGVRVTRNRAHAASSAGAVGTAVITSDQFIITVSALLHFADWVKGNPLACGAGVWEYHSTIGGQGPVEPTPPPPTTKFSKLTCPSPPPPYPVRWCCSLDDTVIL